MTTKVLIDRKEDISQKNECVYAVILTSYTSAKSVRMKVVISCGIFRCSDDPGIQDGGFDSEHWNWKETG
jgi:hypothetical protein